MDINDPEISRTLARLIQDMPFEKRFTFLEDAKKYPNIEELVREIKANKKRYWG